MQRYPDVDPQQSFPDLIAAELGRSEGAVRVLLHRAIAQLGVWMREDVAPRAGDAGRATR